MIVKWAQEDVETLYKLLNNNNNNLCHNNHKEPTLEPLFGYSSLLGQATGCAGRGSNSNRSKDFSLLQNTRRTL